MSYVLVVEDDRKLASFLVRVLREEGYEPAVASSIADAVAMLPTVEPAVLIVDRMLPDGDGLDLCSRVRQNGYTVPVVILTALGEVPDRVAGLDAGADDYIIKPFEIDELLARLRAVLRRASAPVRMAGPLRIDLRSRRLWRDELAIELTAREFDVLAHLIDADGEVLSRTRLLAAVWGMAYDPGTNLVEVHISRLRGKLGTAAWMIETVRGGGYRFRREPPP